MGAWGSGPFENDDAADWLDEVADADQHERVRLVRDALAGASASQELSESNRAFAAAAWLAGAMIDGPLWPDGPSTPPPALTDDLRTLGGQAIERVLAGSEFVELWSESDDAAIVLDSLRRVADLLRDGELESPASNDDRWRIAVTAAVARGADDAGAPSQAEMEAQLHAVRAETGHYRLGEPVTPTLIDAVRHRRALVLEAGDGAGLALILAEPDMVDAIEMLGLPSDPVALDIRLLTQLPALRSVDMWAFTDETAFPAGFCLPQLRSYAGPVHPWLAGSARLTQLETADAAFGGGVRITHELVALSLMEIEVLALPRLAWPDRLEALVLSRCPFVDFGGIEVWTNLDQVLIWGWGAETSSLQGVAALQRLPKLRAVVLDSIGRCEIDDADALLSLELEHGIVVGDHPFSAAQRARAIEAGWRFLSDREFEREWEQLAVPVDP